MSRRLYFLLPDLEHTRTVVDELNVAHIDPAHLHVIAGNDADIGDLPPATVAQRGDAGNRLEHLLWNGNLVLFFLAFAASVAILAAGKPLLALIPVCLMLLTFFAGQRFTVSVPNTHLSDLRDALRHQEVLLMVDVPAERVKEVEDIVHRRHPEAIVSGVGWAVEGLGI